MRALRVVGDFAFAVILPLFHTYMMTVGIFLPFIVGGSIVLVKSLHPPRAMLQEIFSRRATILPAVPSFYRMVLAAQLPTPTAHPHFHQRFRAAADADAARV